MSLIVEMPQASSGDQFRDCLADWKCEDHSCAIRQLS
jgi:hypothetical protein